MTHNDNSTDVYSDNAVSQKTQHRKNQAPVTVHNQIARRTKIITNSLNKLSGRNKIDSNECCPGLVSGINRLEKCISKNYREGD